MAKKGKFKLKGMKKLMKRLDQEVRAIEGRTMKGLQIKDIDDAK